MFIIKRLSKLLYSELFACFEVKSVVTDAVLLNVE